MHDAVHEAMISASSGRHGFCRLFLDRASALANDSRSREGSFCRACRADQPAILAIVVIYFANGRFAWHVLHAMTGASYCLLVAFCGGDLGLIAGVHQEIRQSVGGLLYADCRRRDPAMGRSAHLSRTNTMHGISVTGRTLDRIAQCAP